jgi:2-dehydro-3-deoxygalactonokinase
MAPTHVVVDWGTSSFRLWTLDACGRVLAERRSNEGLAASGEQGFETIIEAHLTALGVPESVPVVMCGMVGSRAGWVEAAYLDAPIRLDHLVARTTAAPSARRRIRILPGIAQRGGARPDVMRGEETQLLSLLRQERQAALVCLPGTHSKWVRLDGSVVVGFSTFMTGELFHLLQTASVLAPAVKGAASVDPSSRAFSAAVTEALKAPEFVTNRVFTLRAAWLLDGARPDQLLAQLSGTLIGLELAGATARYGSLSATTLIAAGPAAALYDKALEVAGATNIVVLDAEDCVRRGLRVAAEAVFGAAELHPEGWYA